MLTNDSASSTSGQDFNFDAPGLTRGEFDPRSRSFVAQSVQWALANGMGGLTLPDGGRVVRTTAGRSEDRNNEDAEGDERLFLIQEHKSSAKVTTDDRIKTYENRKIQSSQFAHFLNGQSSENARARGAKLADCASYLYFKRFYTHPDDPTKLAGGDFCQQRYLCALCAAKRAAVSMTKAVPKVLAAMEARPNSRMAMLTLTCKNRPTLTESADELLGAFAKVLDRRRKSGKGRHPVSAFSQIEGGILSCETKRGKNSNQWHFHAHAVVLLPPEVLTSGKPKMSFFIRPEPGSLPAGDLADEWSSILGYPANLDLQMLNSNVRIDLAQDLQEVKPMITAELMEVFKYALKMSDLKPADQWSAHLQLHGKRLLRSFGCLFGIKETEKFTDDLTEFSGLPFEELFFRFLGNSYRRSDQAVRESAFDLWKTTP